MRRIAFRRFLPLVQLILAIALVIPDVNDPKGFFTHMEAEKQARQHGWEILSAHYKPPLPIRVAAAINFPAIVLSVPALALFSAILSDEPWVYYMIWGTGVLVFWYFVGASCDRRRGLLPAQPRKPPRLWLRIISWIALISCATMVASAVVACTWVLARGGMSYLSPEYDPAGYSWAYWDPLLFVAETAWFTVGGVALANKLHQWRALARAATNS